jgi:hypothetical protein
METPAPVSMYNQPTECSPIPATTWQRATKRTLQLTHLVIIPGTQAIPKPRQIDPKDAQAWAFLDRASLHARFIQYRKVFGY